VSRTEWNRVPPSPAQSGNPAALPFGGWSIETQTVRLPGRGGPYHGRPGRVTGIVNDCTAPFECGPDRRATAWQFRAADDAGVRFSHGIHHPVGLGKTGVGGGPKRPPSTTSGQRTYRPPHSQDREGRQGRQTVEGTRGRDEATRVSELRLQVTRRKVRGVGR
jgi:hypothetical protein